ncbi:hypothetical protein CH249_14200 [Rhodococcus sp. 05-2255-3B1]|uniref:ASCH domain-containing protein n=1 Tax=unclassified Rhodococcus (in: high G+C Gram-positive bacteria) TaxID=192944 RepID=UPI000B9ADF93|nr:MULTISPECIES: ASCH domain-containing protein [unclassified Rhodococcus (in: high G+C Gram-positive bacteria)]OZE10228.1 hypothetical protein CH249_14200 [Rhodococcus sp. 05-2255-3B1]OZE13602.1 hypothetical protein CH250_06935 [Rhodococcus sp. 05-2255-3C]OZE13689.1 hypothetical protein CH255_23740 [Rhodococcus sp. 05-2255-2A2]
MKALTVQQPWAWAIIDGGKTIENRTQNWKYRGPLAIHAGNRWSERGERSPLVKAEYRKMMTELAPPQPLVGWEFGGKMVRWPFRTGAIIGIVNLVDVHPEAGCCKPWGEASYPDPTGKERRQIVHLVLDNVTPLAEPIECVGALGLWTPKREIVDHLAECCLQCGNPRSCGVGNCTNDRNRPHCYAGNERPADLS